MKQKLTRLLAVLLIAVMILPSLAVLTVGAAENESEVPNIDDIENLYQINSMTSAPSQENKDANTTGEEGKLASKPFEVEKNGYIYVGPCPDPRIDANQNALDYIVYWYKKDGKYTSQKRFSELGSVSVDGTSPNVVGEFSNGTVILKIKVNSSNYKFAALKVPTTYADFMLVTVERPFTVDEYYAYADAQGWDIESVNLRPAFANEAPKGYEGLWNFLPREEEYDATLTQQAATSEYKLSDYISVKEGDVITIAGIGAKESKSIVYAYGDIWSSGSFNEIRLYKKNDEGMKLVEVLENDFAIYSFTVPEGISYVRVSAQLGIYNNSDVLVTRNQPFTAAELREALEIAEISDEVKAHPFYGKKALFVGDSISYGAFDTPASYGNPVTALARRLQLATGLIPTNISHPNASVGKTDFKNVVWEYDLLTTALVSKKNYDMVIFQGGINDALKNVPVGEALPTSTDRDVLTEESRVKTFAGGLQLMFHDARIKWKDAELYYIASYKVSSAATNGVDMADYYAQAKALCQAYGVHYIDLYNNEELYQTFDYENVELFASDLFTPTSEAYDLLFPAVLRLFNETTEGKTAENIVFGSSNVSNTTTSQMSASTPNQTSSFASQDNCSAGDNCHGAPVWITFLNNILNFFRRLFGQPELCTCGVILNKE